jgi:LDH2 family malate/lactate/ureidoglycolate dehydrogenase
MTETYRLIGSAPLQQWLGRVFEQLDVPPADAATVAEALVTTSLRGVDTHGVILSLGYSQRLRAGQVKARPTIRRVQTSPGTALFDGDNGLGIVIGLQAMQEAINRAREVGIAVVGVRNSTHFGAVALYVQLATSQGLIGLGCTNTQPVMAAWGGRTPLLGTNPLAIGVPGGIEGGIILDMATTQVAWGKLNLAQRAGRAIPPGWATDKAGQPTTDPKVGMSGLLQPLGGYKGYGLALMVEILSATLARADFGRDIKNWQNVGHTFIAIDVSHFLPLADFTARLQPFVAAIQASEPLVEGERVYLPGEIEAETMVRRRREGIPLPADLIADFQALGAEVGVPFEL